MMEIQGMANLGATSLLWNKFIRGTCDSPFINSFALIYELPILLYSFSKLSPASPLSPHPLFLSPLNRRC